MTRGKKENSIYPWVKPVEHTATEKELTIVLKEKKADQMTFKCEVQVLRDNGYGKLSYITKDGEVRCPASRGILSMEKLKVRFNLVRFNPFLFSNCQTF